jgi:opacity protein-like surface antigen
MPVHEMPSPAARSELGTETEDDYKETLTMIIITRGGYRPALAILLLCAACSATAAESGFYIGLDEGWVKYPGGATRQIDTTTLTGIDLNDTNFAYDLSAGYRFNRYFRLETGWVDLSERSGLVRGSSGDTGALGNVSFSAKGETLVAIGVLPFGKWDASIKAGIFHADAHLGFSGTIGNEPYVSRLIVTNTHPLYGAGLGYNVDTHWRVQLGFTTYRNVGSTDVSGFRIVGPNISTLALGIVYRF